MLFNPPPGYQAPNTNRQTLGGLASPGMQGKAISPGFNVLGNNPALPNNSSFSYPSSQPAPQAADMNQYNQSGNGNMSTLLRTLLGNYRKP